jgi:hypothetical protein
LGFQKRQPDPLIVLDSYSIPGHSKDTTVFLTFARRLLSVSANSASCERLFSVFGNILTKLRNRTGNSVVVDLSEVKMHVRGRETKSRLKRRFEADGAAQRSESAQMDSASRQVLPSVDEVIDGQFPPYLT